MRYHAEPLQTPLRGILRVPGDKSISHRAVLFAASAEGTSVLTDVLDSADVRSTISAVGTLGASVDVAPGAHGLDVTVSGWGSRGPVSPTRSIDCGNSGTTSRLLLGLLAGWDVTATLTGDESLSRRPMARVTDLLEGMGAQFITRDGRLPITVRGCQVEPGIHGIPIASAQVKTALLLAGLRANGRTVVVEPARSRDHTEEMLPAFGVPVGRDIDARSCWVDGPIVPSSFDIAVPADPSSAAFLTVAALLVPGSELVLPDVCLNDTRIGFLKVLERMGADLHIEVRVDSSPGRAGTITARYTPELSGAVVRGEEIPSLIDEVPILAVAAAHSTGTVRFEDVGELRVKESDRLQAIHDGLSSLGVRVRSGLDWIEIDGSSTFERADLDSLGDHRLAMAWAVAGMASTAPVSIDGFEAVEVSYPAFAEDLRAVIS